MSSNRTPRRIFGKDQGLARPSPAPSRETSSVFPGSPRTFVKTVQAGLQIGDKHHARNRGYVFIKQNASSYSPVFSISTYARRDKRVEEFSQIMWITSPVFHTTFLDYKL